MGSFKTGCIGLSAMVGAVLLPALSAPAQVSSLSKGYQLVLKQGIQTQGMISNGDVFNISTYQNLGYTSANWMGTSDPSRSGPAPGYPWARWVNQESDMPPLGDEAGEMSQLYGLSLADELNLNDDATRTAEVQWFNDAHNNPAFNNVILYTNNYSGQVSDAALGDFISRAHPDMLFFDAYPFQNQWTPDHNGAALPAQLNNWESELWRYRQWSIGTGIPFGTYMQTFHSIEDYDQRVYRDPSPSELRANNMIALAFNAKVLTGFTYNNGATSLFTAHGDTSPQTPLYAEQQLVNKRISNWSNTLTRLTPIHDMHNAADANPPAGPVSTDPNFPDGLTTGMMILRGKDGSGNSNAVPIGFAPDPQETAGLQYSWWEFQKNDPYLNGWGVTNQGTKNNGQPGDVIISWLKPLDESFDGPNYNNEIYMMVVNALTDPTGSAADCLQKITLNFLNLPDGNSQLAGNQGIEMLDPDTGQLTFPTLTNVGGGKFQLTLMLDGGDAALFKFNDGAPFVGVPEPSAAMALLATCPLLLKRRKKSRIAKS